MLTNRSVYAAWENGDSSWLDGEVTSVDFSIDDMLGKEAPVNPTTHARSDSNTFLVNRGDNTNDQQCDSPFRSPATKRLRGLVDLLLSPVGGFVRSNAPSPSNARNAATTTTTDAGGCPESSEKRVKELEEREQMCIQLSTPWTKRGSATTPRPIQRAVLETFKVCNGEYQPCVETWKAIPLTQQDDFFRSPEHWLRFCKHEYLQFAMARWIVYQRAQMYWCISSTSHYKVFEFFFAVAETYPQPGFDPACMSFTIYTSPPMGLRVSALLEQYHFWAKKVIMSTVLNGIPLELNDLGPVHQLTDKLSELLRPRRRQRDPEKPRQVGRRGVPRNKDVLHEALVSLQGPDTFTLPGVVHKCTLLTALEGWLIRECVIPPAKTVVIKPLLHMAFPIVLKKMSQVMTREDERLSVVP